MKLLTCRLGMPWPKAWRGVVLGTVMLVGAGRIILTYDVVSLTYDEPVHIAAGLEWIDQGTYQFQQENPPLARSVVALGPYLAGARWVHSLNDPGHKVQAVEVLGHGRSYAKNLTLARIGTLVFFVLATLVVWHWSLRLLGEVGATAAVLLFTSLPPVLAHAGLATTDMAAAAALLIVLYSFTAWLQHPSTRLSILLGLAVAFAVLIKFSLIAFLSVSVVLVLSIRWLALGRVAHPLRLFGRRQFSRIVTAALVTSLVVWGGYRFSLGPLRTANDRPYETIDRFAAPGTVLNQLVYGLVEFPVYPAELINGLSTLARHDAAGHPAYLLGRTSHSGWWYFFPVAFLLKTPIAFTILVSIGGVVMFRKARRERKWDLLVPLAGGLAVMLSVLPASINIGLRHILPMYPLLSIVAGFGVVRLVCQARSVHLALPTFAVLVVWHALATTAAHPNYLSHFNELSGSHPERFLVDSDLDWGQDVGRLTSELKAREISNISLALFTRANLAELDLPTYHILQPNERRSGWVAASIYRIKVWPNGYSWLEAYEPVTLVGNSIRLYQIPEAVDRIQP